MTDGHVFRVQTVQKTGSVMRDAVPYPGLQDALAVVRKAYTEGFMASATIEREDGKIYSWNEIKSLLHI
jgi:hypothetical protein